MIVQAIKTSLFSPHQDLKLFIKNHVSALKDKSILVITSKVIALSQGRLRDNQSISKRELIQVEAEACAFIQADLALTYKDGHWCPNAGIDESNADGKYILWPHEPNQVAWEIWRWMREEYAVNDLGIIISDSRVFPARHGVTAVAIGYAGFRALKDYRGKSDLSGRPMNYTVVQAADALATAAAYVMGEGSECQPLALIEKVEVEFISSEIQENLTIHPSQDLFQSLWRDPELSHT